MNKIEYWTYYNHKHTRISSPTKYNSSPKAQSLHEHEYAMKTRNGWDEVMQEKNPRAALYIATEIKNPLKDWVSSPNTNLDGNLLPSKLTMARKLVIH